MREREKECEREREGNKKRLHQLMLKMYRIICFLLPHSYFGFLCLPLTTLLLTAFTMSDFQPSLFHSISLSLFLSFSPSLHFLSSFLTSFVQCTKGSNSLSLDKCVTRHETISLAVCNFFFFSNSTHSESQASCYFSISSKNEMSVSYEIWFTVFYTHFSRFKSVYFL